MDFWAGVLLIGLPLWVAIVLWILIKVFKIKTIWN